ncbi:MAG: hypothetical protein IH624_02880 [Phycisphaerae bacterium]|nr:hypothetical protein [Phycisphaerae bacterium]
MVQYARRRWDRNRVTIMAMLLVIVWSSTGLAQGPLAMRVDGRSGTVEVRSMPDLRALLASAPKLTVEAISEPVKTVTVGQRYFVPNPDSKTWDLVQVYFKQYGGPNTLVVMDLGTGEVNTVHTGSTYTNFHLAPSVVAPNGKLFLSTLDGNMRQQICLYDPAANALALNAVPMPTDILGETHPMVLGPDGMIYCSGAHPSGSATAVRIDPNTLAVTAYGPLGPSHAPHPCWAYSMGVDDRFIYIASGKTPWYLVAFDRETGGTEVLHTNSQPEGYLAVNQNRGGASCFSRTRKADGGHEDERFWLYEGKAIPMVGDKPTPPWTEAPPEVARPPMPELSLVTARPNENGQAVIWFRTAKDKAAAEAGDLPAPAVGGDDEPPPPPPTDADMEAAGWRGMRFTVPLYPLRIDRLTELPDGRLMGTAGHYQGNFFHNPITGRSEHPGQCGLSHYATVIYDGKVYMSGYPNGPLYVLDPARPWTANKPVSKSRVISETDPQSNPRRLMYLKEAGAKKMLTAAAANGKVYFGGVWMREGNWGGLGWMHLDTGTEGGLWKPFAASQIRYLAAADEGRVLVISTLPVENREMGLAKAVDAPLFFFDTLTDTLHPDTLCPIPGSRCTGPLVAVGGARVLGWTENPADPKQSSILYGIDAVERRVLFTRTLPLPIPIDVGGHQWDPWDFRLGPDGKVWTFMAGALVRIDPADAAIEFVGSIATGGRLAFAGSDVYLGGTETLRRVRGLLAP